MPYISDSLGAGGDQVRLTLGSDAAHIIESYTVDRAILSQPSSFALKLGHAGVLSQYMGRYPTKTPFKLYVGANLIQTGETDGFTATSSATGSELVIRGRDSMAAIHDGCIAEDGKASSPAPDKLVLQALDAVGLGERTLFYTNKTNRDKIVGLKVMETHGPRKIVTGSSGAKESAAQSRMGETWMQFLGRQLSKIGMFLWSTGDGDFVLSEPNGNQRPVYRIIRKASGQLRTMTNVVSGTYKNETTHRHSEATVYARGKGGKHGRAKVEGSFVDDEMFNWGYKRPIAVRDTNVTSKEQAEFYARQLLAQERRSGWSVTYTVSGHTIPAIGGGMATWAPDTVVEVDDEIFGLKGMYWIEAVEFSGPPTLTRLTLMRPYDLIFGSDEFPPSASPPVTKVVKR